MQVDTVSKPYHYHLVGYSLVSDPYKWQDVSVLLIKYIQQNIPPDHLQNLKTFAFSGYL